MPTKRTTLTPGAFKAIVAEQGEGHLVTVVGCIRETGGNRKELWSETVLAVSDVLASRPDWSEAGGALLDAFDAIPLAPLRQTAVALRPCRDRFAIPFAD